MKMLASLSDIPEFKRPNVYIDNKEDLLRKINRIVSDGHKKLQIVTDFDHTLTRHNMDNGSTVLTSYGMFRECPSVPKDYKDEEIRLAEKYKPIEVDHLMSTEEKTKHMIDWYKAGHKLLEGMKFPKAELEQVSESMKECFRIGVKELIKWSEVHQVPVLVFSAGLGECVVSALKAANLLLPHVKVVSNFLDFDDTGSIIGVKGDVIHTHNKNETAIKNTEYYKMVKERNNVLLMGDNIGDAKMAEGMEHCDVIIKIGFLGRNTDGNLQNYIKTFDIVLVNDHTMDVANSILKCVL
ncbi:unnamed protein product [Euphydryas editha]|uniref:5'-nucleotidase n=1 Tax=Euphydryas editha TaxID=104508 RepID=A0AAU9U2X3_EUPED|nr:unnamed protein product [Euphydryas editha]